MIEYLYTEGKKRDNIPISVRVDGKIVGTIKLVDGGFQYFPLKHKQGGEIFKTIKEVQTSLEFK